MSRLSKIFSATAVLAITGCASLPTGPNVMALPGTGVPFDQFRNDDALCEQYANSQVGGGTGAASGSEYEMQQRYDVAYVQCMYAKGHRDVIPHGTVAPASHIPPPPPGTPPPPPGTTSPVFPK
jgi:hypothetical protein